VPRRLENSQSTEIIPLKKKDVSHSPAARADIQRSRSLWYQRTLDSNSLGRGFGIKCTPKSSFSIEPGPCLNLMVKTSALGDGQHSISKITQRHRVRSLRKESQFLPVNHGELLQLDEVHATFAELTLRHERVRLAQSCRYLNLG
jgi:hypothetical protein